MKLFSWRGGSAAVVLLSLLISTAGRPARADGSDCREELAEVGLEALTAKTDALTAGQQMAAYFDALKGRLHERGYLLNLVELSLLAEEGLLLMGPPGNAKSLLADTALGNIFTRPQTERNGYERSYYRLQMTPETTMSETHGPLNYSTLQQTGRQERIYDAGMLNSRNVFIDEIFDGRKNAMRNILGLLAERAHAQGTQIVPGKIETFIGATNRYISEVYERAGNDGPKALIDRFSFSAFVPGEFEGTQSAVALIQAAKRSLPPLPLLTFDEVDKLRLLLPQVEIPTPVAKFLALLSFRLKSQTETLEQGSLKVFREKTRNGEDATPPYRATKYHSPRTLGKAASMLKAIVVQRWAHENGKRDLRANFQDVAALEAFFTLNGPSDEFVNSLLERAVNAHERVQLEAILQERQLYRTTFDQILGEVNETVYRFALVDLQSELDSSLTSAGKEKLGKKLFGILTNDVIPRLASSTTRQVDLTPEIIGLEIVEAFLEDALADLYGPDHKLRVEEFRQEFARQKKVEEDARLAEEARILEVNRRIAQTREALRNSEQQRYQAMSSEDRWLPNRAQYIFQSNSLAGPASVAARIPGSKRVAVFPVNFGDTRTVIFMDTDSRLTELHSLPASIGEVRNAYAFAKEQLLIRSTNGVYLFSCGPEQAVGVLKTLPLEDGAATTLTDDSRFLILASDLSKLEIWNPASEQTSTNVALNVDEGVHKGYSLQRTLYFAKELNRAYAWMKGENGDFQVLEIDTQSGKTKMIAQRSNSGALPAAEEFTLRGASVKAMRFFVTDSRSIFYEIDLHDPTKSKACNATYVLQSNQSYGVEFSQDGGLAFAGSPGGMLMVDLESNNAVYRPLSTGGGSHTQFPIDLGGGVYGGWVWNGTHWVFQTAELKDAGN